MGFPHMLAGYVRVSSDCDRQTADPQRDALAAAGVAVRHLFEDRASGAKEGRPGLAKVLAFVQPANVLVAWKLGRRGRLGGPPPVINAEKLDAILAALNAEMSKTTVCRNFGVRRATLIETLARVGRQVARETS